MTVRSSPFGQLPEITTGRCQPLADVRHIRLDHLQSGRIHRIGRCGPKRSGKQILKIAWRRKREHLAQ
nr:MAG TPA: hypothetical protein [Caudoviricetes sp.]